MPDGSSLPCADATRRPNTDAPRPVAVLPARLDEVVYGKIRLVKNGPFVPARCWIVDGDRDEVGELLSDQRLAYEIDGQRPRYASHWEPFGWPWRPIDEWEWLYLRAVAKHARTYDPSHPLAAPREPVSRDAAVLF